MTGALLIGGILVACFVAYNIGGATTGPAFGPAVGADAISKVTAAALMSVCFFAGAWTIGRRVVDTLGRDLVHDPSVFTLQTSIVVLFFIGGALLVGNVSGAPSSTSMTAVGAIIGLGLASGALNWAVVGEIVSWWIVSPVIGFWASVMIGRYFYPYIDRVIAIDRSDGPLVTVSFFVFDFTGEFNKEPETESRPIETETIGRDETSCTFFCRYPTIVPAPDGESATVYFLGETDKERRTLW